MRRYAYGLKRAAAIVCWLLALTAFSMAIRGEGENSPTVNVIVGLLLLALGVYAWRAASFDRAILLTQYLPDSDDDPDGIDPDPGYREGKASVHELPLGAPERVKLWAPLLPGYGVSTETDLAPYVQVLFDVALGRGLTEVAVLRHRRFRHLAVTGDDAELDVARERETMKTAHLRRTRRGFGTWGLGDIRWADPAGARGLIHHSDPDGWTPTFTAWGPEAESYFDDIDRSWEALSS